MAPPFRGSDEALDREVETLERVARLRLRRYGREMTELGRDLRELKREQAVRRRARAPVDPVAAADPAAALGEG